MICQFCEIITEINSGITQYLNNNDYNSINDIKGLAHQFAKMVSYLTQMN